MLTYAGGAGNDITRTNVPDIRIHFRHQTLQDERAFIAKCADAYYKGMLPTTTSPSVRRTA
jgi:AMP deaminase